MEYDLQNIHGALVAKSVLELFDKGLVSGDKILLPSLYSIRYSNQTRSDIYREAQVIQSYTSTS